MIEETILAGLISNDEYARKVLPFLQNDYFDQQSHQTVFVEVAQYVDSYNSIPTKGALKVSIDEKSNINEEQYKQINDMIDSLSYDDKTDLDWLVDKTEKFCQDKAIYNAVRESILVLDGNHKQLDKGAIPELLEKALGVSFDNSVGHDYLDDSDERYNFYHTKEDKIPFDLDLMNVITKGGV